MTQVPDGDVHGAVLHASLADEGLRVVAGDVVPSDAVAGVDSVEHCQAILLALAVVGLRPAALSAAPVGELNRLAGRRPLPAGTVTPTGRPDERNLCGQRRGRSAVYAPHKCVTARRGQVTERALDS